MPKTFLPYQLPVHIIHFIAAIIQDKYSWLIKAEWGCAVDRRRKAKWFLVTDSNQSMKVTFSCTDIMRVLAILYINNVCVLAPPTQLSRFRPAIANSLKPSWAADPPIPPHVVPFSQSEAAQLALGQSERGWQPFYPEAAGEQRSWWDRERERCRCLWRRGCCWRRGRSSARRPTSSLPPTSTRSATKHPKRGAARAAVER